MRDPWKWLLIVLLSLAVGAMPDPAGAADDAPAFADLGVRFSVTPVDSLPTAADLATYVGYALAHHPELAAARATWRASGAAARAAGGLPDPHLGWGEMVQSVETRVGPQERVLSLQQSLPWFGTLGARRRAASDRADAAGARLAQAALAVMGDVKDAWYDAAFLAESMQVTRRHLVILDQLEAASRAAYESGGGGYANLLKAQIERTRLQERLDDLADHRRAVAARLNAALGRPVDAPLALPDSLPATRPAVPDSATLLSQQAMVHPQLVARDRERAAAAADVAAARKLGWPSLTLGVDWIQVGAARMDGVPDSGKDAVVARLGLSLPVWRGKVAGAVQSANSRERAQDDLRLAEQRTLAAKLEGALADVATARRRDDVHGRELIPRARQSLASVQAAYAAGSAGFLDVLEAERTLLDLDLAARMARRDLWQAATRVETLTAMPMTGRSE